MAKDDSKEVAFGVSGEQDPELYETRWPVVNLKRTSDDTCTCCDGWIHHWANNTRSVRGRCAYLGCGSKTKHGAHIKFYQVGPNKTGMIGAQYIIPLCPSHNHPSRDKPFFVENILAVPLKKTSKCRKSPPPAVDKNNNFYVEVTAIEKTVKCACGTAERHYRTAAKSKRVQCAAVRCGTPFEVIARVLWKDGRANKEERWLIPLCDSHGVPKNRFYVVRSGVLAPPQPLKTCRPG